MRKRLRCVGCEQRVTEATKVDGLGFVCALCMEVLPLVWETEIERVRAAARQVEKFIEDMDAGRL